MANIEQGRLVIVSGPSGAGKTTVVRRLLDTCPLPLELSVSATTRPPRAGEIDGVNYQFLTADQFQQHREADDFLECMQVFKGGDWYGTFRSSVASGLKKGNWVLLEIDVKGAMSVIGQQAVAREYGEAITVFIHPGSEAELERRLRHRGTESEDSVQRRLAAAREELAAAPRYRHMVINDKPDRAAAEICRILQTSGDRDSCTTN